MEGRSGVERAQEARELEDEISLLELGDAFGAGSTGPDVASVLNDADECCGVLADEPLGVGRDVGALLVGEGWESVSSVGTQWRPKSASQVSTKAE